MHDTAEQYNEHFSVITQQFYSSDPGDQRMVLSDSFSSLCETIIDGLQQDVGGLEGMMKFVRTPDVDQAALTGTWIALGVAAAHPGPRQPIWVEQAAAMLRKSESDASLYETAQAIKSGFKMTLGKNSIRWVSRLHPNLKSDLVQLLQPSNLPRARSNYIQTPGLCPT